MPPPPHPGVRFPPPLLFVLGLGAGWLLHRARPLLLLPADFRAVGVVLGWTGILLWAGLTGWAMATFRRARTAIFPNRPATGVVREGPYRFTRNPMYLALVLLYVGVSLLMNSGWALLLLPLVLALLYVSVIRREERYLTAAFGAEYEAYRTRVRRWL